VGWQLLVKSKDSWDDRRSLVSLVVANPTICIAGTQGKEIVVEGQKGGMKQGNRPVAKSKEDIAAGKLKLAKTLIAANPAKAKQRLTEIIEQYPQTEAAKEAKELLGQLGE
jgi:hypothetical protein